MVYKYIKLVLIVFLLLAFYSCDTAQEKDLKIVIVGRVKVENYDDVLSGCHIKLEDSDSPFMGWTTSYTTLVETTSDDSGRFTIIYEPETDSWFDIRITCDETITISDSTGYIYNPWTKSKYSEYYKDLRSGTKWDQDFELRASAYLNVNFHTDDPLSTGDTLIVWDIDLPVVYTSDPVSRSAHVAGGSMHSYTWKIKRDGGEYRTFTDSIKCEKFVVTEDVLNY